MCLCLLRRSVLRSMAFAPALVACERVARPEASAPRPDPSRRWLDVHCHVFNARDVPLYQFIKRTRLQGVAGAAAPLLAIVAGGLRHDATTTEDELQRLRAREPAIFRGPASGTVAAPRARSRARSSDALAGLSRLRERGLGLDGPGSRAGPRSVGDGEANVAPSGREALELFDAAFRDPRVMIRTDAPPSRRDRSPPPPTEEELREFAGLIEGRGRRVGGVLGRYFAWGLMFTEDRDALTSRLATLYPGQELMLTPAMVDYDHWLTAPDNDLGGQVGVMEAITVRRAGMGMPVHSFLAFDPWRCLQSRAEGRDTLADLKAALASGAGIGVKLYPPMGFSAAGNARREATEFPGALRRLTGGNPGAALDDVLDELLDHLADNGIPAMAHCGETNASERTYAKLARPTYWGMALERTDRPRRRELRLNLGHFGGIWELGTSDDSQRTWAREAAELMTRFPNVYADIGYFGSVLDSDPAVVEQTGTFIAELASAPGSLLRRKLMYGSDWSMIGQEERPERYPGAAVAALEGTWNGSGAEDLRWRNAATFLGLGPREATRERLLGFHRRHGSDTAPLLRFDPTT